jgi:hypothetical protein
MRPVSMPEEEPKVPEPVLAPQERQRGFLPPVAALALPPEAMAAAARGRRAEPRAQAREESPQRLQPP